MHFVIKELTSCEGRRRCYAIFIEIFILCFALQMIQCEEINPKDMNTKEITSLEKLRLQLFTNYDKNIEPLHDSKPTNVTLGLSVIYIDIDELSGKVTSHCWLRIRWKDDKRSWNSSEYENITQLHLKPKEVWKPDIKLFNSAGNDDYIGDTQILLYHDGSLLWVPPALYTAYCTLNFALWPFDTQTCKLKIGSVTLTVIDPSSTKSKENFDYSDMVKSTEWTIIDGNMNFKLKYYYNFIEYTLVLQRRSTMYTAVIFTPASCIVLLALATFWLPPHMGEKILLNGITIVIIAAFLMYFANILPIVANNVPLVVLFYSWSILLVSISTAISVCVLYLSTSKHKRRVPDFIKNLLNGRLGTILLLSHFTLEADGPIYDDPDNATDPFNINPEAVPSNRAIQFDWILLANAVDRIFFIIYCIAFIIIATLFSV